MKKTINFMLLMSVLLLGFSKAQAQGLQRQGSFTVFAIILPASNKASNQEIKLQHKKKAIVNATSIFDIKAKSQQKESHNEAIK